QVDFGHGNAGNAVFTASPVTQGTELQKVDHFAKCQCAHGEVNATSLQRQVADDETQYGSHHHAQEQGDQHVADNVGSKQISRDEAARTVKCCLPERQQAGIAEQQVKSEPEQAPYQNAAQQSGPHSQQGSKNWHGAKDDAHHEFKTVPLPDPLTA